MKPYYSDGMVTIYHGDCREFRPTELACDVVVTDPPYGVGVDRAFDDDLLVGAQGCHRAGGKRGAFFMSPRRVCEFVERIPSWKFERLLWMFKDGDIAHPWRGWHMNSEAIIIASRTRDGWPVPTTTRTDCYIAAFAGGKTGHPASKPISVVSDLITRLSNRGDLILDPFVGSGTTLRAAKDLGRKAVGIDIEERYCEMAARRCAQEVLDLDAA